MLVPHPGAAGSPGTHGLGEQEQHFGLGSRLSRAALWRDHSPPPFPSPLLRFQSISPILKGIVFPHFSDAESHVYQKGHFFQHLVDTLAASIVEMCNSHVLHSNMT